MDLQAQCNEYERYIAELHEKISKLTQKIQGIKEEHQAALDEGYQEAFEMLQAERARSEQLEVDLYEEYDKKLKSIKEFIVGKVHQFLNMKWEEYQQTGQEDLVAKLDIWRQKMTPAEMVDEALAEDQDPDHDLKEHVKIVEAKNIRLQVELAKMKEMKELLLKQLEGRYEKAQARTEQTKKNKVTIE